MEARTRFNAAGVPIKPADEIRYDPSDSGLAATDVQAAIDELALASVIDGSVTFQWKYDMSGFTATEPGSTWFRVNNSDPSLITEIYFDSTALNSADATTILDFLKAGNRVFIQQKNDGTRATLFEVTAPTTDNTGWFTVPVSVIDTTGTLFSGNDTCAVFFVLSVSAAGYTVATLPTPYVGRRVYVTDALAPAFLTAVAGGGAVKCPVFYNGAAWVVG
jgi:hypothetical protein